MSAVANPTRGEIVVTLDGIDHALRPTFEAISMTEALTGLGLIQVTRRLASGDYGLRDVAFAITAGLAGAGSKLPPHKIEALVFKMGVMNLGPKALDFVMAALNGGRTTDEEEADEGEAEAAKGEKKDIPSVA